MLGRRGRGHARAEAERACAELRWERDPDGGLVLILEPTSAGPPDGERRDVTDDLTQTRARDPRWPKYLDALRDGATERAAAVLAGIPRSTITSWVKADDDLQAEEDAAREEYLSSRREIVEDIARGAVLDAQQARVRLAASTWLLEKRDPERFGQRTKSEISGPSGAPLQVQSLPASREAALTELEQLHAEIGEELARRKAGG